MQDLLQKFSRKWCKPRTLVLKAGMIIKVHQKIKEGKKERVQIFEGIVIATGSGNGISETFTVRKIASGVGVDRCFLFHSPTIIKIEIMRDHKVRRAKINFFRKLTGKKARLKEVPLRKFERVFEETPTPKTPTKTETKETAKTSETKPETTTEKPAPKEVKTLEKEETKK